MYYLFGAEATREMLCERCDVAAGTPLSDAHFQSRYNAYLEHNSIISTRIDWTGIRLVDFSQMKAYAVDFCERKATHYAVNSALLRTRLSDGYFERAIDDLTRKAPGVAELAKFCVRIVIINQLSEYTNGTTEDTLGVANFDFRDAYNELDFQELLFHQLTHMLLFLDDSMRPHMSGEDKEIMIPVGLPFVFGGTDFPAYLAFHSYIVAVEMLLYRSATEQLDVVPAYHRSTDRVLRVAGKLQTSLLACRGLFQPRGIDILDRADGALLDFLAHRASPALEALD